MLAHLSIRVLPREGPRDAATFGVATLLPRGDLGSEERASWEAPVKTLAVKDADFYFRHVEPTGVQRGVVEDNAAEQVPGHRDAEHLLEADAKVGVEIVEHQMDAARGWVDVVEQVLDEGNEVDLGPAIGHLDGSSSALGFDRHEQIASPGADVLVVALGDRGGLHR